MPGENLIKISLALALTTLTISLAAASVKRPNIVFILADNQSPSTLGCYGNKDINSPNIDRLAREGIKFNQAFACNGMSSPSRASILTGLIPSQHGLHTQLSDQLKDQWPKDWCAVDEFRSLPQTLSDAGYKTALIGKFHLGIPFKPQLKFDYWATFPEGHTWCFYGNTIVDNGKTYTYPGHITELWTEKAVEYINNYKEDKPFFMYLAYDAPYGLPPSVSGTDNNRFSKVYAGREMSSFPRLAANKMLADYVVEAPKHYDAGYSTWIESIIQTLNDPDTIRNYASQIAMVDDGVGKVMEALDQKGLAENTMIVFSADQGLAYGQKGLWGQTEDSLPSNLYDTPLRTPLIFRHKNSIPAGQETNLLTNDYDLLPSLLEYLGLGDLKIADSPGKSFAPLLRGEKLSWPADNAIYFEQELTRAVRTSEWKYIKRCPAAVAKLFTDITPMDKEKQRLFLLPNAPIMAKLYGPTSYGDELYDLKNDPEENINLVNDPKYQNIKGQLNKRLTDFFDKYADPKYDLWKGGTAKSNANTEYIWKALWPNWKPVTEKAGRPFSDK